jgi:hypothetical protein
MYPGAYDAAEQARFDPLQYEVILFLVLTHEAINGNADLICCCICSTSGETQQWAPTLWKVPQPSIPLCAVT